MVRIIETQRSIIENNFNSIFQDAKLLKNSWEGNSADAYQPVMGKLSSIQDQQSSATFVVNALREYALDLTNIASQFESAEKQNKAQGDALPGDIFGV